MAAKGGPSSAPGPSPLSAGAEGPNGRRTRRSSRLLDSDQGSNDSSSSNRDSDQAPEMMLVKEELPLPVKDLEDIGQLEDKLEPKRKQRKEINTKEEENEFDGKKEEKEKSRPRRLTPKSNPRCNLACCLSKIPNREDKMSSRSGYSSAPGPPPLAKGAEGTHPMRTRRSSRLSDSDHGPNDFSSSNRDPDQAPEMTVKEELPLPLDELEDIGQIEDQEPPEKKRSIECEPEVPNIVAEEKTEECVPTEEDKDLDEELLENDEKYKSCEEPVAETSECNTPTLESPALPLSILASLSEALLSLGQDESRSVKSESDITVDVGSLAEGSESAGGLEANTTSISLQCSTIIQEKDLKGEAAQSSQTEDLPTLDKKCSSSTSQTLTRSPARGTTSPPMKDVAKDKPREKTPNVPEKTYTWSFPPEILDNMTGEERIIFIQAKMQEMMQRYSDLQSEVAAIDQMKRFKKKGRKVTLPGASKSSPSSEAGRSPPSSSPPLKAVTVECS